MRRRESSRTQRATAAAGGATKAHVFVATGAVADPRGKFACDFTIVRASTDIPDFGSDALPLRAVPSIGPSEGVGNLVQQNLVDLVVVEFRRQMA